jgi:transcriptional regulator with XRE-family HTH domain
MESMLRSFGDKLLYLRRQRQLSQANLARLLSPTSRYYINNLESGRRLPSLDIAVRAAVALGVTVEYLVRDEIDVASECKHQALASTLPETRLLLGAKIRHLRLTHSKSQSELAQALELQTQAHISLLESGQSDISLALLLKMAALFDVAVDYFVRDSWPVGPMP